MSAIKNAMEQFAESKGVEIDEITPEQFTKWLKDKHTVELANKYSKFYKLDHCEFCQRPVNCTCQAELQKFEIGDER